MIFGNIKSITIPEGEVKQIVYNGTILWEKISRYLKTITGKIITITDALNESAESLKVTLEPIQSGSGTPSPSNPRPISGHTECVTSVAGVNVWDEKWESGQYNPSTGAKTSRADAIRCKNLIPVKPNTSYYFGCTSHPSTGDGVWLWYKKDGTYINYVTGNLNRTQTSPSDAYFMAFYIAPETTYNHDISINYPSTDTSYHAYDGDTYTTTLGRTVYGGTLDVVSGVLTVDRAMVDLSTLTWSGSSGIKLSADIANVVKAPSANNIPANIVAEKYATSAVAPISANDGKIGIEATGYRGRIQCGSSETPSGMLCYELATPQTYQLTPQTISLLHGNNNVWSDGSVEVTYWGTEQSN